MVNHIIIEQVQTLKSKSFKIKNLKNIFLDIYWHYHAFSSTEIKLLFWLSTAEIGLS